jgi:hypothetical protein
VCAARARGGGVFYTCNHSRLTGDATPCPSLVVDGARTEAGLVVVVTGTSAGREGVGAGGRSRAPGAVVQRCERCTECEITRDERGTRKELGTRGS